MFDALSTQDVGSSDVTPSVAFVFAHCIRISWHVVNGIQATFLDTSVPHMVVEGAPNTVPAYTFATIGLQKTAPVVAQHRIDTFPSAVIMNIISRVI